MGVIRRPHPGRRSRTTPPSLAAAFFFVVRCGLFVRHSGARTCAHVSRSRRNAAARRRHLCGGGQLLRRTLYRCMQPPNNELTLQCSLLGYPVGAARLKPPRTKALKLTRVVERAAAVSCLATAGIAPLHNNTSRKTRSYERAGSRSSEAPRSFSSLFSSLTPLLPTSSRPHTTSEPAENASVVLILEIERGGARRRLQQRPVLVLIVVASPSSRGGPSRALLLLPRLGPGCLVPARRARLVVIVPGSLASVVVLHDRLR